MRALPLESRLTFFTVPSGSVNGYFQVLREIRSEIFLKIRSVSEVCPDQPYQIPLFIGLASLIIQPIVSVLKIILHTF